MLLQTFTYSLIFLVPLVVSGTTDNCATPIPVEDNDCGLAGLWRNQLGSYMNFTCRAGQISGLYMRAVGNAAGNYVMSGRYLKGPEETTVLGWAVSFDNEYGNTNATAAWSGLHYATDDLIRTHGILTRYHPPSDYWVAVTVSHNEFERICDKTNYPANSMVIG